MGDRLKGKTAFITAAGQGMGRATAVAFAQEGAKVWATDRDGQLLKSLDGAAGTTTRALDVTRNVIGPNRSRACSSRAGAVGAPP